MARKEGAAQGAAPACLPHGPPAFPPSGPRPHPLSFANQSGDAFCRMAILPILEYPDPRLRMAAAAVERVTPAVRRLAEDLLETMYAAPGIGLAATQVDVHKRVMVVDASPTQDEPHVFINPEVEVLGGVQERDEGCLSVPGFYETVQRAERIRVTALDREGQPFSLDAEGMLAVCIQHERDHLDGRLFVDYLSSLKRNRIRKRLDRRRRAGAAAR